MNLVGKIFLMNTHTPSQVMEVYRCAFKCIGDRWFETTEKTIVLQKKIGVYVVSDKKHFFHYKVMPVIYLSESQ